MVHRTAVQGGEISAKGRRMEEEKKIEIEGIKSSIKLKMERKILWSYALLLYSFQEVSFLLGVTGTVCNIVLASSCPSAKRCVVLGPKVPLIYSPPAQQRPDVAIRMKIKYKGSHTEYSALYF
jgi:hypothetical protein